MLNAYLSKTNYKRLIQNQHYFNKFPICSFSLDRKMNQKDQGYTQFVKTITPFPKRKKLVPKTRDFKQLFFFNGKQKIVSSHKLL